MRHDANAKTFIVYLFSTNFILSIFLGHDAQKNTDQTKQNQANKEKNVDSTKTRGIPRAVALIVCVAWNWSAEGFKDSLSSAQ